MRSRELERLTVSEHALEPQARHILYASIASAIGGLGRLIRTMRRHDHCRGVPLPRNLSCIEARYRVLARVLQQRSEQRSGLDLVPPMLAEDVVVPVLGDAVRLGDEVWRWGGAGEC